MNITQVEYTPNVGKTSNTKAILLKYSHPRITYIDTQFSNAMSLINWLLFRVVNHVVH